jgi:adenine phosphoribosyltransferase
MPIALREYIHSVPDFPKPGILFRDISPLLQAPEAFACAIDRLAEELDTLKASALVAVESRGFLFGAPLAIQTKLPLILVRKPGKLPGNKERMEYGLEYGTDTLEVKAGMIPHGARVAVIDDVLATGGTAAATGALIEKVGGVVAGYLFLIELGALEGRTRLSGAPVSALVSL